MQIVATKPHVKFLNLDAEHQFLPESTIKSPVTAILKSPFVLVFWSQQRAWVFYSVKSYGNSRFGWKIVVNHMGRSEIPPWGNATPGELLVQPLV